MLGFLKKIFKEEKQELKFAEVNLQNLEEWVTEKSKPLMEELTQQTESILMNVNEEIQRTRVNIELLENARLQNPDIPFKAKQYMEGNRKAHIKSVNSFLGRIEINNKDYFYLLEFCKEFDGLANEFSKATIRSHSILQEFFSNEVNGIARNIKSFDDLFKELKKCLNGRKIVEANKLKQQIENLAAKNRLKINMAVDYKNTESDLKLLINEKEEMIKEIDNFSKSEEHNNFLKLKEEKKSKEEILYNEENQILQSFAVLERPLRKYSHVVFEHEEMVISCLNHPLEFLSNDKNYTIIGILNNLQKMIFEDVIKLDERKKEKSLEEIKKLTKEFIEDFVKRYASFKSDMQKLNESIESSKVEEKFRNFNKQLESLNIKIEKTAEEFNKIKNDYEKLNASLEDLTNEIQNSIKSLFDENVKVAL